MAPQVLAEATGLPDPARALASGAPALIHEAFEASARRVPDALALESAHGRCSYAELERVTRALAWQLRERGAREGTTVAIYAERSAALVFALLGVARSGAAFVVLDAAYPSARLIQCARQLDPALLVVAGDPGFPSELSEALGLTGDRVVRVPAEWHAALTDERATAPTLERDAQRVAYYSFTSGSTGAPKGIRTSHAPLPHFVAWHVAHGGFDERDRFSMLSGLGHDPLLRDVFTPLSIGASLHIPTQAELFDADALFGWFAARRITVAHMTPAFGEILCTGADGGELPALRRVFWGGDVLTPRLARALQQLAPALQQTNFYGATETPQAMAYCDLTPELVHGDGAIPLGRAIEGAQLLVIDADARLCAPGTVGEIWIRSPYLAQGYLDEAATEARFVPNPFRAERGDRCYRTGDRGVYREDGQVEFRGRGDEQLKLRGFRIEPAEIVQALERDARVRRALVDVTELHGERLLVAYVAHGDADAPTRHELQRALAESLPAYMVPNLFQIVREFPLLPNGKLDLQALRGAKPDLPTQSGGAPRNARERELAAIWCELLGLPEVDIHQSFLELGGDSLTAIRALSRMRRLGLSEHVARGIFQGHTIAEIASGQLRPRAGSEPKPLVGTARTTALVNALRGFLVATLVVDHYREGIFKRLHSAPRALEAVMEPLFDLPTPGFAFVFGIGLSYSQYANYLREPRAVAARMWQGAWVLALGTLLMGLSRNLGVVARHLPLDYHLFSTNFFLPTFYYALAMASAPLWFRVLCAREGKWGGPVLASLALAVAFRFTYEGLRILLLPHEQVGLLQLGRLMLTARFSYFNLSSGALVGVAIGLYLRAIPARTWLAPRLAAMGAGGVLAGLGWWWLQRDVAPDALRSPDLPLAKWLLYIGVSLMLGAGFDLLLNASGRRPVRFALSWLGVVGQCAMPIFILQGMALDWSAFLRWFGVPDRVAALLSGLLFVGVVFELMRRIHRLYHGALGAPPEPAGHRHRAPA